MGVLLDVACRAARTSDVAEPAGRFGGYDCQQARRPSPVAIARALSVPVKVVATPRPGQLLIVRKRRHLTVTIWRFLCGPTQA
jgi:hypothetical protein